MFMGCVDNKTGKKIGAQQRMFSCRLNGKENMANVWVDCFYCMVRVVEGENGGGGL